MLIRRCAVGPELIVADIDAKRHRTVLFALLLSPPVILKVHQRVLHPFSSLFSVEKT
jgi:hypothetical protein